MLDASSRLYSFFVLFFLLYFGLLCHSAMKQNCQVATICSSLMCKNWKACAAFVELTYKLLIYYLTDSSKSSKQHFLVKVLYTLHFKQP